MRKDRIVPAASSGQPPFWMLRSDATPRRMVVASGQLRSRVGYDTLVSRRVEAVTIADAIRFEIVAPFVPPSPRMALIAGGICAGLIAGSQIAPPAAAAVAVVCATFGAVSTLIGGPSTMRQRLARIKMRDGTSHTVSYRYEDEEAVRRLFSHAAWDDANITKAANQLLPEEEHRADALRIGIVLSASAIAIIVMLFTTGDHDGVDAITIPYEIIRWTCWGVVAAVTVTAWCRMVMLHHGRRKGSSSVKP